MDTSGPKAPPGWYEVEGASGQRRYWDGENWAPDEANEGPQSLVSGPQTNADSIKKRRRVPLLVGTFITLAAAVTSTILFLPPLTESTRNMSLEAEDTSANDSASTPSPSEPVPRDWVNKYEVEGMTEGEALSLLSERGVTDVTVNYVACYPDSVDGEAQMVWNDDDVGDSSLEAGDPAVLNIRDCDLGMRNADGDLVSGTASERDEGPSWYPDGYSEFSDEIAYQFVDNGPNPCGSIDDCQFSTANLVSKWGCPNGLYAEMNLYSSGVVVDWTNDSVPSLRAGQVAQLQFVSYEGNIDQGEIVTVNCR